MSYYSTYRWCAVPECKNTSVKTPNKLWIQVPNDINMRKTWFKVARRDPELLSGKTRLYFCEDHFDLEHDMENYTRLKIMGSVKKIIMKPNTVPSKFKHREDITPSQPTKRTVKGKVATSSTSESATELRSDMPVRVKEEPDWQTMDACGVSEAAAAEGLYAGHLVKDELVLGPEVLQAPDVAYGIQVLDGAKRTPAQTVRPCSVRLERLTVDAARGLCSIGHEIYKLRSSHAGDCGGQSVRNEHTLSDIIKQFERQARSGMQSKLIKTNENRAQLFKKSTEGQISKSKAIEEVLETSRSSEIGIKAEAESVAKSGCNSSQNKKRNKSSILADYKCDDCGRRFRKKSILKIHILTSFLSGYSCSRHTDKKRFHCDQCGYNTNKRSTFQQHQMVHSGEKPYKCSRCDYACRRKCDLSDHEAKHSNVKRFQCDHCNYKSHKKAHLVSHQRKHTIEKPFKCKHCDYATKYKTAIQTHELTHTGEKPYECRYCDFKCSQRSNLRTHERRHIGEKPYKCSVCKFKCVEKYGLQKHQRVHTGEKPFKCSYCNFRCRAKGHLLTHERTHTGEKPFKCSFCDYACIQKSNMTIHERTHTGEKPYKCKSCAYSTAQKTHLTSHQKIHTGEKPYKCSYCDFKCCEKGTLRVHQMRHTGEKPYQCANCDYRCRTSTSLRVHQKIHAKENPLKCAHCKYSCRFKGVLSTHLKIHSGGKK